MAGTQRGRKNRSKKKKFTGRNNGPARQRYWSSRRLEERKIRALMAHNGLARAEAYVLWHTVRIGRKK